MFCAECGQEILNRSKFCPVCGVIINRAAVLSNDKISIAPEAVENKSGKAGTSQEIYVRAGKSTDGPDLPRQKREHERNKTLFYSSVGLLITGVIQYISFNPLLTSGFSAWKHYAYMRGIPLYISVMLPYAMIACDLLVTVAGVVGIRLSRLRGASNFYKISGVITAITSSGVLILRIIHKHVIFMSADTVNSRAMLPETIMKIQEQFSRSLYPLFIFAAISAVLSFCQILGATRPDKPSTLNAGKAMLIVGISGFAVSLCGIFFGQYAGNRIPLVAAWAAVAFGVMVISGIAGSSRRIRPTVRSIFGFTHFTVFSLCMLQTIYYAYSALVQGTLFPYGSFIMIAALSGILAVSTILSAFYVAATPGT